MIEWPIECCHRQWPLPLVDILVISRVEARLEVARDMEVIVSELLTLKEGKLLTPNVTLNLFLVAATPLDGTPLAIEVIRSLVSF